MASEEPVEPQEPAPDRAYRDVRKKRAIPTARKDQGRRPQNQTPPPPQEAPGEGQEGFVGPPRPTMEQANQGYLRQKEREANFVGPPAPTPQQRHEGDVAQAARESGEAARRGQEMARRSNEGHTLRMQDYVAQDEAERNRGVLGFLRRILKRLGMKGGGTTFEGDALEAGKRRAVVEKRLRDEARKKFRSRYSEEAFAEAFAEVFAEAEEEALAEAEARQRLALLERDLVAAEARLAALGVTGFAEEEPAEPQEPGELLSTGGPRETAAARAQREARKAQRNKQQEAAAAKEREQALAALRQRERLRQGVGGAALIGEEPEAPGEGQPGFVGPPRPTVEQRLDSNQRSYEQRKEEERRRQANFVGPPEPTPEQRAEGDAAQREREDREREDAERERNYLPVAQRRAENDKKVAGKAQRERQRAAEEVRLKREARLRQQEEEANLAADERQVRNARRDGVSWKALERDYPHAVQRIRQREEAKARREIEARQKALEEAQSSANYVHPGEFFLHAETPTSPASPLTPPGPPPGDPVPAPVEPVKGVEPVKPAAQMGERDDAGREALHRQLRKRGVNLAALEGAGDGALSALLAALGGGAKMAEGDGPPESLDVPGGEPRPRRRDSIFARHDTRNQVFGRRPDGKARPPGERPADDELEYDHAEGDDQPRHRRAYQTPAPAQEAPGEGQEGFVGPPKPDLETRMRAADATRRRLREENRRLVDETAQNPPLPTPEQREASDRAQARREAPEREEAARRDRELTRQRLSRMQLHARRQEQTPQGQELLREVEAELERHANSHGYRDEDGNHYDGLGRPLPDDDGRNFDLATRNEDGDLVDGFGNPIEYAKRVARAQQLQRRRQQQLDRDVERGKRQRRGEFAEEPTEPLEPEPGQVGTHRDPAQTRKRLDQARRDQERQAQQQEASRREEIRKSGNERRRREVPVGAEALIGVPPEEEIHGPPAPAEGERAAALERRYRQRRVAEGEAHAAATRQREAEAALQERARRGEAHAGELTLEQYLALTPEQRRQVDANTAALPREERVAIARRYERDGRVAAAADAAKAQESASTKRATIERDARRRRQEAEQAARQKALSAARDAVMLRHSERHAEGAGRQETLAQLKMIGANVGALGGLDDGALHAFLAAALRRQTRQDPEMDVVAKHYERFSEDYGKAGVSKGRLLAGYAAERKGRPGLSPGEYLNTEQFDEPLEDERRPDHDPGPSPEPEEAPPEEKPAPPAAQEETPPPAAAPPAEEGRPAVQFTRRRALEPAGGGRRGSRMTDTVSTNFKVQDVPYEFRVRRAEGEDWEVDFLRTDRVQGHKLDHFDDPRTGAVVMANVRRAMRQFIDENHPERFVFRASTSEPRRVRHYDELVKRIEATGEYRLVKRSLGYGPGESRDKGRDKRLDRGVPKGDVWYVFERVADAQKHAEGSGEDVAGLFAEFACGGYAEAPPEGGRRDAEEPTVPAESAQATPAPATPAPADRTGPGDAGPGPEQAAAPPADAPARGRPPIRFRRTEFGGPRVVRGAGRGMANAGEQNPLEADADFETAGRRFNFSAKRTTNGTWHVGFGQYEPGSTDPATLQYGRLKMDQEQHGAAVFARVRDHVRALIDQERPQRLAFDGDAGDPERVALYDRLARKLEATGQYRLVSRSLNATSEGGGIPKNKAGKRGLGRMTWPARKNLTWVFERVEQPEKHAEGGGRALEAALDLLARFVCAGRVG